MKRYEEDDDPAYTYCAKCGEKFERVVLLSCSFCSKPFCSACAVRIGGKNYCSRTCWELMFFGEGEPEDGEGSDDEG